jgi:putative addiction module CopG family antidote
MSIQLTPALEQLIHSKVQTGQYKSAEEVLETAMKLLNATPVKVTICTILD